MVDDVRIIERPEPAMAAVLARRGAGRSAVGEALAVRMPGGPGWTAGDSLDVIGTGPGSWLLYAQAAGSAWCEEIERRLAGLASVSDQSGAYRLFHLEGPHARTLLQRGANVDLDDAVFPAGSAAVTVIGHVDVIIRCLSAGRSYDVAVYRSYTDSFLRWLDAAVGGLQGMRAFLHAGQEHEER